MLTWKAACAATLAMLALAPTAAHGQAPQPSAASPVFRAALTEIYAARDRMQREISAMASIREAQKLIERWHTIRASTDHPPIARPPAMCSAPEMTHWCQRLPATFGLETRQ